MKSLHLILSLALFSLAACSGSDEAGLPTETGAARPSFSGGGDDPLNTPEFFHRAPTAPNFANPVVSFWAVKGVDKIASIWYHKLPGAKGRDSTEFVRFKVDKRSLLTRPDGTPIANGDSVLITMTVVDTVNLIVDFQPSGLQFDPNRPATLIFKLKEADHDVNGDGVIDNADQSYFAGAQIFGQESLSTPWFGLATTVSLSADSYTTLLTGFTRYAVAY